MLIGKHRQYHQASATFQCLLTISNICFNITLTLFVKSIERKPPLPDDVKLYTAAKSVADNFSFQSCLDLLYDWSNSKIWQLTISNHKCCTISISKPANDSCPHFLAVPVSWWYSIVVRTLVSAGELFLSCTRLLAGWVTTLWLSVCCWSANMANSPIHPQGSVSE